MIEKLRMRDGSIGDCQLLVTFKITKCALIRTWSWLLQPAKQAPAESLGWSEGSEEHKNRARETGDSTDLGEGRAISNTDMREKQRRYRNNGAAPARLHGLGLTFTAFLGLAAPGFMLTPASQAHGVAQHRKHSLALLTSGFWNIFVNFLIEKERQQA
jgi:hypothetical protein